MTGQTDRRYFWAGLFLLVAGSIVAGVAMVRIAPPESKSDNSAYVMPPPSGQIDNAAYSSLNEAVRSVRHKVEFVGGPRLAGHPDGGYVAQNQANGMAAIFTARGTEIRVRSVETAAAAVWRLSGVGYGENMLPLNGEAKMSAAGDRFIYTHKTTSGLVEERFDNRPTGLEQSFVVSGRPGRADGSWLRLTLAISGGLTAKADDDGQSLTLSDADGNVVLSYRDLMVWDANEKALAARMRTEKDGEIWLEVDERDAVYPVTVDPTFVRTQVLTGSDTISSDSFGADIAIDGNTVVISSAFADVSGNADQGAAYVFIKSGQSWVEQAKLTANDGAAADHFGSGVAIEGDTIVIGADSANADKGAAYLFTRNGTAWTQQGKLTASDGVAADLFGGTVALEGDTLIVAAPADQVADTFGSAYYFKRINNTWTEQQKISRSGGLFSLGTTVVLQGTTLALSHAGGTVVFIFNGSMWTFQASLVGYPTMDLDGDRYVSNLAHGAGGQFDPIYYTRSGTTWTRQPDLPFTRFGAVAIKGDDLFIGAALKRRSGSSWLFKQYLVPSVSNEINAAAVSAEFGAQSIFVRPNTGRVLVFSTADGMEPQQQVTATDGQASDVLGFAVDISGNTVIVGAIGDDFISSSNQGSAYIFVRNGSTWTQQAKLVAGDGAANDNFGISVAIEGDKAIVGATGADFDSLTNPGAAYIFTRSGTTWTQKQKLKANTPASSDDFGRSVDIYTRDNVFGAGPRIYVGAPLSDEAASNAGAVFSFTDNGSQWIHSSNFTASDPANGDRFGQALSAFNSGVVIGAPFKDAGQANAGVVYYFNDSGTQLDSLSRSLSGAADDNYGFSLAAGDTNMLVGARNVDVSGNINQGVAYLYHLESNDTWTLQQTIKAPDGAAGDIFGYSLDYSNDLAVIGAPGASANGQSSAGAAYVFARDGSTMNLVKRVVNSSPATGDDFGIAVAVSLNTVIVGADSDTVNANAQGSAAIFTTTSNGKAPGCDFDGDGKSDVSVFRPSTGAWYLNRSAAGVFGTTWGISTDKITPADYDGDGKTDIAVFRPSEGRWYILNSATSTFTSSLWGASTDIPAPADYDGDGRADVSIFRPSDGNWWLNRSTAGTTTIPYGQNGDIPAVGDYDGDGKADVAIFRPSNGVWSIHKSSGGDTGYQFGFGTDKITQADYDGDGKTDIAIYRPSTGQWFIANSGSATFPIIGFGAATDIPTPGDYDGDGKSDVAIFRPSDGNWWLNRSTAGVTVKQFGQNGDKPAQNAYGN